MAEDKRQERLTEIANELFEMANTCALEDETGNAGTFLHEAVNNIWTAQKCLKGDDQPIPMELIMRSMGMNMGQMVMDAVDISDMARENDED